MGNFVSVANCRVSSNEQLSNNSLNRQQSSVLEAAVKLNAPIVKIWSGSVSSKAGTNVKRKDLRDMLNFCRSNKKVKYAIFDEYDRYMRSVNEGPYFEVLFQQLGVKVWYASESDTFNGDDALAKFMSSMSAYKAEGSNEERQRKSISGQTAAIFAGKYPFVPKPGYRKGRISGIPDIDPVKGPALQKVLKRVASNRITPSEGLIELNNSRFMQSHSTYRMDKFRSICTDPFYAGIVDINKQVKIRNENGLHVPLVSRAEHLALTEIFKLKKKVQGGPKKNGNPKYPCNNLITCAKCKDKINGRLVGFDHGNGKPNSKIYEKYRCRSCGQYISREDLHDQIKKLFYQYSMSTESLSLINKSLTEIWKKESYQSENSKKELEKKIAHYKRTISIKVDAAIDPDNEIIKEDILSSIEKLKRELKTLINEYERIERDNFDSYRELIVFGFGFLITMGFNFLELSPDNRLKCKQMIFPEGILLDSKLKVYTPSVSPLFSLSTKKIDAVTPNDTHMVRVRGL